MDPHHRQITTYEALQSPFAPAHPQQSYGLQRRDMNFLQPTTQRQPPQDDAMVSITNPGQSQQHYLQVAQQHCTASPGLLPQQQQHQLQQPQQYGAIQISQQEFRHLQHQQLDAQMDMMMHNSQQQMASFADEQQHVVKIERSRSNPESRQNMLFPEVPHVELLQAPKTERSNSVISVGQVEDKRSLHPNWHMHPQRPLTPPQHNSLSYLPITPDATPSSAGQSGVLQQQFHCFSGQFDPNATIRASAQRSSQPCTEMFGTAMDSSATIQSRPDFTRGLSQFDMFGPVTSAYLSEPLPSPPNTVPLRSARHFDVAAMPTTSAANVPKLNFIPLGMDDSQGTLLDTQNFIKAMSDRGSSPCSPDMAYQLLPIGFHPPQSARQVIEYGPCSSPMRMPNSSPSRTPLSPEMGDLSLDATIEDTGISAEEVQSYISEHDLSSGKWTCLFPDCGKMFGRKENIRSHVQTHLGDRQYKCLHCEKRFVRQHDLKRHSKIHSGVKPYPCRCGNSFARHDALTRHRQRGICDGGFEGVVKKIVKRGRPRKARPDNEDRADKSSRTRKRATGKNYASSVSGTSESSYPDSPPGMFVDNFEEQTYELSTLQMFDAQSLLLQSFTPPMSPRASSPYSTGDVPSPRKAASILGSQSMESTPAPDDDQSMTVSARHESEAGSPPELSHSSPPLSARPRELDLDDIFRRSGTTNSVQTMDPSASIGTAEFDMMTMPENPWNDDGYFNFDKDPNERLKLENYSNSMMDEDSLFGESAGGFF